jgi:hypothetical protein
MIAGFRSVPAHVAEGGSDLPQATTTCVLLSQLFCHATYLGDLVNSVFLVDADFFGFVATATLFMLPGDDSVLYLNFTAVIAFHFHKFLLQSISKRTSIISPVLLALL